MSRDELLEAGTRSLEWIADYLTAAERYPVLSATEPGDLRSALPDAAPNSGEPMGTILDDFERLVIPGITHWNHPGFFAYFAISGSAPGILGELLCSALNVNAMLWQTSPAATELEEVVLDWLRKMVGLPGTFSGVIVDTASVGVVCAVAAARHQLRDLNIRELGLAGRGEVPALRFYASEHAHSSVDKAAILLGIGRDNLRKIPSDAEFRLDVGALERAIAEDRQAGYLPFCVVATVGTTSVTSVDPVRSIAQICSRERLWLHVDAAYAGAAAIVPEFRHVLDGCEHADSLSVNPHKWLFTPIDCSALYVRKPQDFTDAFSLVPEYLQTATTDDVTDYMDWGIALGRRFRALKLWFVLRYFGSERIAGIISRHIALAHELAGWIDAHDDFERLAPTPFSLVCFRARPRALVESLGGVTSDAARIDEAIDEFNEKLLWRVNRTGALYISHTRLRGRYALRFAIGNLRTTEEHVRDAWAVIQDEANRVLAERA